MNEFEKKNVVCCNTTALNFNNFNRKYTLYLLNYLCWGAMMNFILFSTSQYARILQKCNLGKAHSLSGWSLKSILFWICKKWLDFQMQRVLTMHQLSEFENLIFRHFLTHCASIRKRGKEIKNGICEISQISFKFCNEYHQGLTNPW